ncbi:MAG: nucleoside recognition domain-containing protein [Bdellovibrionales bacterium]
MDFIENALVFLSSNTSSLFEGLYIKSFIEDAFFGGLGAFLVFTPQIFFLTFIIKSLEETGYLARASIICHKFLMLFGLSGESFIPILTSHACAIPGIYAARHIKSTKIRILTILTLPLTLCSARLPVYALLITLLIPNTMFLGGLLGARGLMLFGLYMFGVSLTLFVSLILNQTKFKSSKKPFLALELPRYQIPSLRVCLKDAASTTYHFIRDAGFIIFVTNCFIWLLATFPKGPGNLSSSYLSKIGTALLPLSRPLGLDWPETIALLTSFLARETFVSTLGTLYGTASDDISALSQLILENAEHYSTASTLSLIVFFAIALQCISTLAVLRKELPNKNSVYSLFFGYLVFAYAATFVTYRVGLLIF